MDELLTVSYLDERDRIVRAVARSYRFRRLHVRQHVGRNGRGVTRAYGSRTGNARGLAHYRAVRVSEDGTYRVFTLVSGATIEGNTAASATVTVATARIMSIVHVKYERQGQTGADGPYSITVSYRGHMEWLERRYWSLSEPY